MTYLEKLKDPRWQKKRLEILERDKWTCASCGDKKSTLHVHHIFYLSKTEPWDVPSGLLITLCEDCHKPAPCTYGDCKDCPDFQADCYGQINIPEQIINAIALLLNSIWGKKADLSCVDNLDYQRFRINGVDNG